MEEALPFVSPDRRGGLLEALDSFIRRSEARSDLRALALQLQHRLIASPGNASGLAPLLDQDHVARWVLVPPPGPFLPPCLEGRLLQPFSL